MTRAIMEAEFSEPYTANYGTGLVHEFSDIKSLGLII